MRVFFGWLEESECIVKSPMKRIKLLPAERKAKEFLEDDEVKTLMRVMDKSLFSEYRDLLIMMVMLDSGTRLGETLSITNEELNGLFLPTTILTKGLLGFILRMGKLLMRRQNIVERTIWTTRTFGSIVMRCSNGIQRTRRQRI